jgi:hypothetical protein
LDRADDMLALHTTKIGGRTLHEHLELAFCNFRCERNHSAGDLRRMMPTRDGIISLHAPGLRIYGWCPRANELAAVTFALETETKSDKTLNDTKRNEVRDFIKKNKLSDCVLRGDISALFPHQS